MMETKETVQQLKSLEQLNSKIDDLDNRHIETDKKIDLVLDILRGTLSNPEGIMNRLINLEKNQALLQQEVVQLEKFKETIMTNVWKIGGAITAFQLIAWAIGAYISLQTLTKNEKKEPIDSKPSRTSFVPNTTTETRKINKEIPRITI